jgi:hypothetical protein
MHSFVLAMKADAERRKKLRKKPLSLVYVELASSNGGMMRDLSEEGFAVRAMIPLRAGQKTPFAFSLGESTRIEGEGLVDWIEENGRIAGVKFVNIPATARDLIDEWLLRSDEPATREGDATSPPRPEPSTIEELREELRTAPPRPVPPKKEPPSPEAVAQPVVPQPPSGEEPSPTGPPASPPPVPEEDMPFPFEPAEPLSVAEETTEAPSPPAAPENGSTEPPIPASSILPALERRWRMPASSVPAPRRESEQDDFSLAERNPNLPDISSILIQPCGTSPRPRAERARLEHLPALEQQAAPSPPSWAEEFTLTRAITIMLILAFVVATYVFHRAIGDGLIWLGEKIGGTRQEALRAPADQGGAPGTAVAPEADSNPPVAGLPASKPEIQRPITGSTQSSFPTINPPPTATPLPETFSSAVAPENEQAGQPEYLQAVQILRGNSGIGTVEVVRLLWISVEKGNPSAEIVLADLYWHARGVARNCDQTRILLTAAARKGSAVAQKQLQQFQQEGCE